MRIDTVIANIVKNHSVSNDTVTKLWKRSVVYVLSNTSNISTEPTEAAFALFLHTLKRKLKVKTINYNKT